MARNDYDEPRRGGNNGRENRDFDGYGSNGTVEGYTADRGHMSSGRRSRRGGRPSRGGPPSGNRGMTGGYGRERQEEPGRFGGRNQDFGGRNREREMGYGGRGPGYRPEMQGSRGADEGRYGYGYQQNRYVERDDWRGRRTWGGRYDSDFDEPSQHGRSGYGGFSRTTGGYQRAGEPMGYRRGGEPIEARGPNSQRFRTAGAFGEENLRGQPAWDPYERTDMAGGSYDRSFRGRGPKGYQRNPERIREEACERLTYNDRIDASELSVDVDDDGVVHLKGEVDSRWTKRMAEDVVDAVRGVRDVRNEININEEFFSRGESDKQSGSSQKKSSKKGS